MLRTEIQERVEEFLEEAGEWLERKRREGGVGFGVGWLRFDTLEELGKAFKCFVQNKMQEKQNITCKQMQKHVGHKIAEVRNVIIAEYDVEESIFRKILKKPESKKPRSLLKAPKKNRDVIGEEFKKMLLEQKTYKVTHGVGVKLNFDNV